MQVPILCPPAHPMQEESHLLLVCVVHGRELSPLLAPGLQTHKQDVSIDSSASLPSAGVTQIPPCHCLLLLSHDGTRKGDSPAQIFS